MFSSRNVIRAGFEFRSNPIRSFNDALTSWISHTSLFSLKDSFVYRHVTMERGLQAREAISKLYRSSNLRRKMLKRKRSRHLMSSVFPSLHHPFWSLSLLFPACNVLSVSTTDPFTLRNYGRRINCTFTAVYPGIVRVIALGVGSSGSQGIARTTETGTLRKVRRKIAFYYISLQGAARSQNLFPSGWKFANSVSESIFERFFGLDNSGRAKLSERSAMPERSKVAGRDWS